METILQAIGVATLVALVTCAVLATMWRVARMVVTRQVQALETRVKAAEDTVQQVNSACGAAVMTFDQALTQHMTQHANQGAQPACQHEPTEAVAGIGYSLPGALNVR